MIQHAPCPHRSLRVAALGLMLSGAPDLWTARALAQACTQEQITAAINSAGEKLRQMTRQTQPVLQAKLVKLKEIHGWSDTEYQEKGYNLLEDERTAKLDATANELLGRLDQMGSEAAGSAPDCGRLADIEAAGLELQATVRAKSQYLVARVDQLIGEGKAGPSVAASVPPAVLPSSPPNAVVPPKAAAPVVKPDQKWSTATKSSPPKAVPPVVAAPVAVEASPAPVVAPPAVAEADGFTIDEIVGASQGVFGKVSANLARVLEHTFSKSGKPKGYILGQETGAAFIAGLRYGSGTLHLKNGQSMPIHWHGPSLGADVGAQGAATLFLVYKAERAEDVLASYTGIEGSAFVVGGVGATYMSNGRIDMAPIRSGLGLRVGANIGYVRFTRNPTWNPF